MSRTASNPSCDEHEASRCLARSVVDTLAEEPTLEAVTIDRAQSKISVATLGRADVERLTNTLTERFHQAQQSVGSQSCGLLTGNGDCATCDAPLSDEELKRVTIKREGPATTIA